MSLGWISYSGLLRSGIFAAQQPVGRLVLPGGGEAARGRMEAVDDVVCIYFSLYIIIANPRRNRKREYCYKLLHSCEFRCKLMEEQNSCHQSGRKEHAL